MKEKRRHHLFPQPSIHSSPLMSSCLQGAGSRRWKKGKQLQLVLTGNSSLRLGVVMVCWKDSRGGSLRLACIGGGDCGNRSFLFPLHVPALWDFLHWGEKQWRDSYG